MESTVNKYVEYFLCKMSFYENDGTRNKLSALRSMESIHVLINFNDRLLVARWYFF